MKKKILSAIMIISIVLSMVIIPHAHAENGMCGENVTWTFENGVLTISGIGDMKDYGGEIENDLPEWKNLPIERIVVEEGITSIGSCAFFGVSATQISIPDTVTTIKNHAFVFSNIEHLVIPDSVKYMGEYTICDSLVTLKIGSGLEKIDDAIGFQFESNLKEITVDENNQNLSSLDGNLFNKDKTKLILYAASQEGETYTVPDTVKVVGNGAFERCEYLKNIIIPEGVEEVEYTAILCSWILEKVKLPSTLKRIYVNNFDSMSYGENIKIEYSGTKENLEKILVDRKYTVFGENPVFEEIDGILPEYCVEIIYNPIIKVLLNGERIAFDVQPQIIDSRTMVPMRAIFEELGAIIEWDSTTRTVIGKKDDIVIKLTIEDNKMYLNDKVIELDVPAKITDNRTLVPVRAVSEAFECKVDWDETTKTVIIEN